jgi:cytoskeletal protein CcmA (bactofilin family)
MQKPIPGPGTVVGANVRLNGVIKDVNDIAVHGHVEGEVISDKNVLIGETAVVKGPISGQIVTVSGTIRGSVEAHIKLELLPTARLYGGITTKELIIRSGALFNGKSAMTADEKGEEEKDSKSKETDEDQEKTEEKPKELEYEREA